MLHVISSHVDDGRLVSVGALMEDDGLWLCLSWLDPIGFPWNGLLSYLLPSLLQRDKTQSLFS